MRYRVGVPSCCGALHPFLAVPLQVLRSSIEDLPYFLDALQKAKPAQLARPVAIFGQKPQPAVRLAALSFEHAVWTLGQVVPYLRLNGVTPPEYHMPF